jgi:outer membrane receptor for ferric coprogen and ferric-rhodotorulic acid
MPTPKLIHSAWFALVASATLSGQTSPSSQTAPTRDEPVALSPFVISTSADTGYAATQTLAGTRLRTEMKDTPVSLSVLTEDFLNDIAATSIESVVDFLPNTSVFTVSGGDDSGNSAKQGDPERARLQDLLGDAEFFPDARL